MLADLRCVLARVSAKDFGWISSERFYVCGEVKLVSSLSCLKNIVRFIRINCPIRPAVLPAESAELASIILGRFVAKASDVISSPGVDGDATEIINGVCVAEDNIAVGVCVLLCAVHRMAVAVDKGERAALVDSTD